MRPTSSSLRLACLMAVALATGCGRVSGPGADAGDGDGDQGDGGSSSGISGTRIDVWVTADGEEMAPVDLSAAVIEVLVEDGGTYRRIPGTGEADGSFAVDDVPQGTYLLKIDDSYFATDARSLDLGFNRLGRPDAATVNSPTPLRLDVQGLDPWQLADRLDLVAPNAGSLYYSLASGAEPPLPENATAVDTSLDYQRATEPFLIDGGAGDVAYLLHMGFQEGPEPYRALTQVYQAAPFTMVDGDETVLAGSFTDVKRDQSVTIDLRGTTFEAAVGQLTIGEVAFEGDPLFTIYVSPYSIERGGLGSITLGEYYALDLEDHTITMEFGNPFPAGWIPYEHYNVVQGSYVDAEQSALGYGILSRGAALGGLSGGPVELGLGPVRQPTVDGEAVAVPIDSSATPILSWDEPMIGTAASYSVTVRRVDAQAGIRGVRVAGFTTTATSLRIPDGVMEPGETYFFEISAVADPTIDAARAPFRRTGPAQAFSQRPTAAATVQ